MRQTLSSVLLVALAGALISDAEAGPRAPSRRATVGGPQASMCSSYPAPENYVSPDDGTEYYITTGNSADIDSSSGSLTYDWWMRCAAAPALNANVLGREPGGQIRTDFTAGENLRLTWYVGGGATRRCRWTSDRITVGRWQHFTFRFNQAADPGGGSSNAVRNQAMADAWLGGVATDFDSCAGSGTTDLMAVAASGNGEFMINDLAEGPATAAVNCEFARVRMFDGALTDTQVAGLHNDTTDISTITSLRVRWLEDSVPTTATVLDESGRGNNGTGNNLEAADMLDVDGPIITTTPVPRLTATGSGFAILVNGQSLSIGTNGTTPLTTTQPFSNVRNYFSGGWPALIEPLVTSPSSVETGWASMTNHLRNGAGSSWNWVTETYGGGGTAISAHIPGGARYNALVTGATDGYTNRASGTGTPPTTYRVPAIVFVQGEQDTTDGTLNLNYLSSLRSMQQGYQAAIRGVTGQTEAIPVFLSPPSSNTAVSLTAGATDRRATAYIADAQLCAQERYPNEFYVIGPKYGPDFSYSDGVHGVNTSYRDLGNRAGQAELATLINGYQWRGLAPRSIRATSSTNIQVCYYVPCQLQNNCGATQLTLDTTLVTCPRTLSGDTTCRDGYELYDPNPVPRYITAVAVSTTFPNCVDLTTDSAIQSGSYLTYAYTGIVGALAGTGASTSQNAARGNLRDTTTVTGYVSTTALYNWGVHHGPRAITGGAAPTASIATLIDDQRWSWIYTGANCPSGDAAWNGTPVNINAVAAAGSHTCGNTTSGNVAPVFGATRVNAAMNGTDGTALSASSWQTTGAGTTTWNIGTDDDIAFRYIGELAIADSGHGTVRLFTMREDTTNADISLQVSTAGTITLQVTTQAADVTHNWTTATNGLTASAVRGILDVYIKKRGWAGATATEDMTTMICWRGVCNTSGAVGQGGAWGPGNLTIGGNQSGSSTNYFSYVAYLWAVGERARNRRGANPVTGTSGTTAFTAYHVADYQACVAAGYCE